MADDAFRKKRRHEHGEEDQRDEFQRDRDRILYSTAFRRLEGVTQIVRAGESDIFHDRFVHSVKVAQVGRRLAEHCKQKQSRIAKRHGLDAEVVEAACLAHDLGHPPFGHIGEETLNRILTRKDIGGECLDPEGFEGNAQSFRIVTKLAVRFSWCNGLNLTRATLGALLKYPWARDISTKKKGSIKSKKWGYYNSEKEDFDFCREGLNRDAKTLEAEMMDWADDISYSVHDLEDFHRCNHIPWTQIFGDRPPDRDRLVENTIKNWQDAPGNAPQRINDAYERLSKRFAFSTEIYNAYEGTREQRLAIRTLTSTLIGRYVQETGLADSMQRKKRIILQNDEHQDEIRLLKQITMDYILSSPSLAAQQRGHIKIIEHLFEEFIDEIKSEKPMVLPRRFHHLLRKSDDTPGRIAADCIASLTEGEAIALHRRLNGTSGGSVLDPIVR